MRVFADFHHNDLYWSLHALFEKRLGWELYRPIGLDWFRQSFWKIAEPYGNNADTIAQYLEIDGSDEPDLYARLNGGAVESGALPGVYLVPDAGHPGTVHKGITLQAFKDTPFDLIVSTYGPPHDEAFDLLQRLYQPKAKRMAQMGNWQQVTNQRHVLHSAPYEARVLADGKRQHTLHYHQEIDRRLFRHVPPDPGAFPLRITSLVNLLPEAVIFDAFRVALPEVTFRAHGAGCPDGALPGAAAIAPVMRAAHLGWHIKPFDGFGHTAMGWMATGRAVITRMDEVQQYGWDAPRLFVPGETCIAVQGWDVQAGAAKIRRALEPDEMVRMGLAAAERFAEVCDYDGEEPAIREFLAGVMA